MGIFEIISAIVLIIACVFIVIVVLMQDTKTQMSKTISGNSSDNYFGKNSGRTKEAKLNKAMTTAAVIFFILAILVNIVNVYFSKSKDETADTASDPSVSDGAEDVAGGTEQAADGDTDSEASDGVVVVTVEGAVSTAEQ